MNTATPLDAWTAAKIGMEKGPLNRELLNRYQHNRLSRTIRFAAANSPFYRGRLGKFAGSGIKSMGEIASLPFTTTEDLRERGPEFLCVSQSQISRVVTLNTSGTTGESKRLWFTPADQALTVDFFRVGMSAMINQGDKVLVLLPGDRPGSVGDLLAQALNSAGVETIQKGPVRCPDEIVQIISHEKVDSIVGIPVQVLALARYSLACRHYPVKLKSVLVSTDYAARSLVREVEKIWGCRVFDHYGMTEMGLGGGVECEAHDGFHLREADLYFEIIDPDTGELVPDGCEGEVVFSTLTRQGMPLIRYRTGDISRFLPAPCSCGSVLKRLDKIACRLGSTLRIPGGREVRLALLDEILFSIQDIFNYSVDASETPNGVRINLKILVGRPEAMDTSEVMEKICRISQLAEAMRSGQVQLTILTTAYEGRLVQTAEKRKIRKVTGLDGSA